MTHHGTLPETVTLGTELLGTVFLIALAVAIGLVTLLVVATLIICVVYMPHIVRVFEEEPLLLPKRHEPAEDAEEVRFRTADGLWLQGAWLPARGESEGVVVFCPGFKMDRWTALEYLDDVRDLGLDLFTYEFRNQGESDAEEGYRPMQWVTTREVRDVEAALAHVRARQQDRGLPERIVLFGISRGGGAALVAASRDRDVLGLITDGAFPTHGMQLAFMLRWVGIYANLPFIYKRIPLWYYSFLCFLTRCIVAWRNRCWLPSIERAARRLAVSGWLMIHGAKDSYIPPRIARQLYELARCPKELWLVPGARHNQCHRTEPEEYSRRVRAFLLETLQLGRLTYCDERENAESGSTEAR